MQQGGDKVVTVTRGGDGGVKKKLSAGISSKRFTAKACYRRVC